MKWVIKDKPKKSKSRPNAGDCKLVQKFCWFPRQYWNIETGETEWYWLQKVYVAYKYYAAEWFPCPWGIEWYEKAHWGQIGVTDEYSKAVQRGWVK
jgi:hypothetical protein